MLDIRKLVNDKLDQMEADKTIENAITGGIEKTILKCVEDAVTGYEFRRDINKKIEAEVSDAVSQVDFTTYNAFIISLLTKMLNETMREDIRQRVETALNGIFVSPRTEIKLSEIFETYRNVICESEDERDKYERQHFHASMDESEYGWFDICLNPEKLRETGWGRKRQAEIAFTLHVQSDKKTGWISSLALNGVSIEDKLKIGYLHDAELMLLQAQFNKTPIIIDIEGEYDIDTSYDVDF